MKPLFRNLYDLLFHRWTWVFVGIGVLRIVYCFRVPLDTTDLLRNIGYGIEFWKYGPLIYDLCPEDFAPASYSVLWSVHQYTYPAITILFFSLLAKIWPSLVFGKLVMTILAAVNSRMIFKLTQSRALAFLYWAHPIGIWYGSHEGQFEEMAAFWVLLSLLYLMKKKPIAYLYLAIAIQTKLFPVFLFPYFIWKTYSSSEKRYYECILWSIAGFIPSLVFFFTSQYLTPLFGAGYVPRLNHIPWAVLSFTIFPLQPFGIMFLHTVSGLIFLACSFRFLWKTKEIFSYFASVIFVFFVKYNSIGQGWYMLLATPFCLTIENEKHRNILFLISLTFGFGSLVRMVYPYFRHNNLPEVLYLLERTLFWIQ
ncbi:MAG: hypothetical protein C4527_24975 [Candidatus Omnitrophota bacterium]|jgi:hypothetical protein|nr:MAG: hypothetical protein C4527_24975 [Candidatus Omnitrophota bacterium]